MQLARAGRTDWTRERGDGEKVDVVGAGAAGRGWQGQRSARGVVGHDGKNWGREIDDCRRLARPKGARKWRGWGRGAC